MWRIRKKSKRAFNKQWIQNAAENVGNEQWIWDEEKEAANKRKHGIDFETATHVLNDPLVVSCRDPYPYEERCQTIGVIHDVVVLVVHTTPKLDIMTGKEIGRIISARKATPHERRDYEEGNF
ncbi:MAG TPA: BrnT family toxin [Ktedonobacteraceae bacterium]|nr:BrnT family toxin [Ktedonobacteraceae bacterium]